MVTGSPTFSVFFLFLLRASSPQSLLSTTYPYSTTRPFINQFFFIELVLLITPFSLPFLSLWVLGEVEVMCIEWKLANRILAKQKITSCEAQVHCHGDHTLNYIHLLYTLNPFLLLLHKLINIFWRRFPKKILVE